MLIKLKEKRNKFIPIGMMFLFLFATFPGKGGLEGDQRELSQLSERSDNWGFVVPFIVGNWPNILGHWRFTLVFTQLLIFWIGLWLMLRNSWRVDKKSRKWIAPIVFASSVFVSQLWRDATLLALTAFALGILSFSIEKSRKVRMFLVAFCIFTLHFAAMFKVLYGGILGLLFFWVLNQGRGTKTITKFASICVVISLIFLPFIVDRQLSGLAGLKKVFPEQQPIIFDLASNYCWGQSSQITNDAAEGLKNVLRPNFPLPSVCSALKPNSWDNLHSSSIQWEFSSPITRISGEEESKLSELRSKWITMIIRNPMDWIQTRLMYLGWTLSLSNSFVPENSAGISRSFFWDANSRVWQVIFIPASLMDKFRLTSILFALCAILILFFRSAIASNGSRSIFIRKSIPLFFAVIILLTTTALTLVGFVASNGRYVFPYVTLTYVLLLRSLTLSRHVRINH